MKNKVVNYDGFDYDYTTYWGNRQYEDNAEHIVLNSLLKNQKGEWFIDIGGSYGRLTDTYANNYKNCIIIDYSLKTLKKNNEYVVKKFPNTTLIAANAYKMPFKDSSFDGGLMVRVLHHIERQEEYFTELSRILRKDSIYIQEFANKIHLKAKIRAIIKGDKSFFDKKPFQQPTINMEGSRNGDVSFLNFHPEYIKDMFKKFNFEILKKQGCSYLRIPLLKKVFGTDILTFKESILQKLLAKTNISPSIFFKTRLLKDDHCKDIYNSIEDILVCPSCKGSLKFGENTAICDNCHKKYIKDGKIWDFRME
jgi:ubiquinone/menaquinone biosynthesis C-methylase UbiE